MMIKKTIAGSTFYSNYENLKKFERGQIYYTKTNTLPDNHTNIETNLVFYVHKVNKKSMHISILCVDTGIHTTGKLADHYESQRFDINDISYIVPLENGAKYGYNTGDIITTHFQYQGKKFIAAPLRAIMRGWWNGADNK